MNKNKIISNIFILVLFYFPIYATCSCLFAHYELNNSGAKKVNWEKIYPFSYKKDEQTKNIFNFLEIINNKLRNKSTYFEQKFSNYLPFRYKICEFQMTISKLLGINLFLEYDGLVVLKNGYLSFIRKYTPPIYAENNIIKFVKYIKSLGIDFVYINYPDKNSKYDIQLPIGLKDSTNKICDEFLKFLNDNNVYLLDLRENLSKENKLHYDMFFKTDHHWKPSAGLWASKEICKYLNDRFKWNINTSLLDKEKFKTTILPNFFLGSQGKKITLAYVKPDDFFILEPSYETNFKRICPEWGKDRTSSFKDVMFSEQHTNKIDFYKMNPYAFYLDDDKDYLRYINNSDCAYNKKVLLIKDSFNLVVAPFLALGLKDLTIIDTRMFNGSLKSLIKKEKFDLVMIAYNASIVSGKSKLLDFD